ncbi:MAG: leucyl aminopeptidase family protein [Bacteroidota bacterium]
MKLNMTNPKPNTAARILVDASGGAFFEPESLEYLVGQGLVENDHRVFYTEQGQLCYLLRLKASRDQIDYAQALDAARLLAYKNHKDWPNELIVDSYLGDIDDPKIFAVIEGLSLGMYQIGKWKSEPPKSAAGPDLTLLHFGKTLEQSLLEDGSESIRIEAENRLYERLQQTLILADVEKKIMDLVNAPANHKRPQDLAAWAKGSAEAYGYSANILDKAACRETGLHALLSVNRGSEDGAQFIILEYKHDQAPEDGPTALVGKGVTFDTGGVSLKRPTNMHLMKSDMGGAAAVLATLEAAARMQLPLHLVGIVPATDNSVGTMSVKPSDVIQSYSGKTIEIIDTDAEGRLILSDGLAYAIKHFEPAQLVSIATLTGSAVRTFGYECAALFSKNEDMVSSLQSAGNRCGQKCWPLPPWDAYRSDLDSDVADIANMNTRPIAGAIDAFKFLEFFTSDHEAYAHLDIAGVALKAGPYGKDRTATAFGPRLLLEWLRS